MLDSNSLLRRMLFPAEHTGRTIGVLKQVAQCKHDRNFLLYICSCDVCMCMNTNKEIYIPIQTNIHMYIYIYTHVLVQITAA